MKKDRWGNEIDKSWESDLLLIAASDPSLMDKIKEEIRRIKNG
jgi:hypothetical protein